MAGSPPGGRLGGRLGGVEDVPDHDLGDRRIHVIRSTAADIEALALRYVLEHAARPAGVHRVTGTLETQS